MTNGSAISLRYDKIGFTIGRSPIERKGDLVGHEPVLQRWRKQVRGNRTDGVRRRDWRRWPQDRRLPFPAAAQAVTRSEEHTSELQTLMRISYAVLRLKTK